MHDRIPASLVDRYGVTNLWRVRLPGAWRALYTITTMENHVRRVVILWIGTHRQYDRLFGYSK